MARELAELVDAYLDQNQLYRIEGRQGVENLCQLSRALGYRDPMNFGQLSQRASIGDLVCFLEDNPGVIESMIEWVREQRSPEMVEALKSEVAVTPGDVECCDTEYNQEA